MWIAIEGIDGAGKSSVILNLQEKLLAKKIKAVLTKEPGGTELGQKIRSIIETTPHSAPVELFLFAADRQEHYLKIIKPAITQNKLVISDRSVYSSIAYQGYGHGLNIEDIVLVNKIALENRFPDLLVYLKLNPVVALARIKLSRNTVTHFEKLDYLEKVANGFDELTNKNSLGKSNLSNIINEVLVVDANLSSQEIADLILQKINL
jgi:dTMP kinase